MPCWRRLWKRSAASRRRYPRFYGARAGQLQDAEAARRDAQGADHLQEGGPPRMTGARPSRTGGVGSYHLAPQRPHHCCWRRAGYPYDTGSPQPPLQWVRPLGAPWAERARPQGRIFIILGQVNEVEADGRNLDHDCLTPGFWTDLWPIWCPRLPMVVGIPSDAEETIMSEVRCNLKSVR